MDCTALCSFFVILVYITTIETNAQQAPISTGLYKRIYIDGLDGSCKISLPNDSAVISKASVECEKGWVRNGTNDSERYSLPRRRRCKFYKKTSFAVCYDGTKGEFGQPTCKKSVISYYITPACSGYWLNWEQCDKTCGGGQSARVKIIIHDLRKFDKYQIITEVRPCNTRPCPVWTPWKPTIKNNTSDSCDIETCTRKLERQCVYNSTVVHPSTCVDEKENDTSLLYLNLEKNGSTHLVTPCFKHECVKETTAIESMVSYTTQNTNASVHPTPLTLNGTNSSSIMEPFMANTSLPPCPVVNDNMLLGVAVGFVVASCIFAIACFVLNRELFRKKIISVYHGSLCKNKSRGVERSDSIVTGRSAVGSMHSLLNEEIPLSPLVQASHSTLPTQREGNARPENAEALYCTVPNKLDTSSAPNAYFKECHNKNSLVDNESTDCMDAAAAGTAADPVYSDIPAFMPSVSLATEHDVEATYSSSEFSNEEDNIGADDSGKLTVANPSNIMADAAKSFDSDEGRDVVNTLRKSIKRPKSSRLTDDQNEVFLSEDELSKDEYENERKSAFSTRYSKILAKKSKLRGKKFQDSKVATNSDFQWIEGSRRTPTQSESSIQSNDSRLNQHILDKSRENSQGHNKWPCRLSSGTSSVKSFNVDVTTSGYNSALTASPSEDRFVWSKRGSLERQRLSNASDACGRWKAHNTSNGFCNEAIHSDQTKNSALEAPNISSTLCNPKHPHPMGFCKCHSLDEKSNFLSRRHVLGTHIHTMPGKSGNGCHTRRMVEMEDIYSSPIDAKEVKDPIYVQYDVPFDALPS
ncbi:uncharacterized protein LOC120338281 [Styela clava]